MSMAMETKRFCADCGDALPAGKRFCPSCGAANDGTVTAVMAPAQPAYMAQQGYPQAYPQQAVLVEQKSTTGKTMGRMGILLLVTLFGMGLTCVKPGVGIIFLMCVGIVLGLRKLVK